VKREDGTIVKPLQSWELHSNYKLEVGKKKDEGSRRAIDLTNPNQPRSVRVIDCLAVVPEMERIAKLIGFDLEKAKLEADGKIPPPKS